MESREAQSRRATRMAWEYRSFKAGLPHNGIAMLSREVTVVARSRTGVCDIVNVASARACRR